MQFSDTIDLLGPLVTVLGWQQLRILISTSLFQPLCLFRHVQCLASLCLLHLSVSLFYITDIVIAPNEQGISPNAKGIVPDSQGIAPITQGDSP